MFFSLVKRERLWYTDAIKALLSAIQKIFLGLRERMDAWTETPCCMYASVCGQDMKRKNG